MPIIPKIMLGRTIDCKIISIITFEGTQDFNSMLNNIYYHIFNPKIHLTPYIIALSTMNIFNINPTSPHGTSVKINI